MGATGTGSYFVLKYEDVINLQLGGGFATSILLSLVPPAGHSLSLHVCHTSTFHLLDAE